MDWKHRATLIELHREIAEIERLGEARARAAWRPAPPEKARICRLAPCRRHRACQSDAVRRACRP